MLPYTAYLRVYEPVAAFPEPLRAVWTAYAESGSRPQRDQALDAEHGEALRRLAAVPPVAAPDTESSHAYVRRSQGVLYVCPWETRLRSWLACARFLESLPPGLSTAFMPEAQALRTAEEFERWKAGGRSLRPHILSSTWHVPLAWFVLFDPSERCLHLGDAQRQGGRPQGPITEGDDGRWPGDELRGPDGMWVSRGSSGAGEGNGPTMAPPARTLIYVTGMHEARGRVQRAQRVAHSGPDEGLGVPRLDVLGRWLGQFHPSSLVELDYGGLVHLIDDERLRADESAREVAVALAALERGEQELTLAMYQRLRGRWRSVQALESAN